MNASKSKMIHSVSKSTQTSVNLKDSQEDFTQENCNGESTRQSLQEINEQLPKESIIGFISSEDSTTEEESNYFKPSKRKSLTELEISSGSGEIIDFELKEYLQPSLSSQKNSNAVLFKSTSNVPTGKNLIQDCFDSNLELKMHNNVTCHRHIENSNKCSIENCKKKGTLLFQKEKMPVKLNKQLHCDKKNSEDYLQTYKNKAYHESAENITDINDKSSIADFRQLRRRNNCWMYDKNDSRNDLNNEHLFDTHHSSLNIDHLNTHKQDPGITYQLPEKHLRTSNFLIPYKLPGENEVLQILSSTDDDSDKSDITTKVRHVSGKDADELDAQNPPLVSSQIVLNPPFENENEILVMPHIPLLNEQQATLVNTNHLLDTSSVNQQGEYDENKPSTVSDKKNFLDYSDVNMNQHNSSCDIFSSLAVEVDEDSKFSISSGNSSFSYIKAKNASLTNNNSKDKSKLNVQYPPSVDDSLFLSNTETSSDVNKNFALHSAHSVGASSQDWQQLNKVSSVNNVLVQTNISAGNSLHDILTRKELKNSNTEIISKLNVGENSLSNSDKIKSFDTDVSTTITDQKLNHCIGSKRQTNSDPLHDYKDSMIMETHRKKYILRLQHEIQWLEKVERLLFSINSEVQISSSVDKRCTLERSLSPCSYHSHGKSLENVAQKPEILNAVMNQMDKTTELLNEFPKFSSRSLDGTELKSPPSVNTSRKINGECSRTGYSLPFYFSKFLDNNNIKSNHTDNSKRNTLHHYYESKSSEKNTGNTTDDRSSHDSPTSIFGTQNSNEMYAGESISYQGYKPKNKKLISKLGINRDNYEHAETDLNKDDEVQNLHQALQESVNLNSLTSNQNNDERKPYTSSNTVIRKCSRCNISEDITIASRSVQTSPTVNPSIEKSHEKCNITERCFVTLPSSNQKHQTSSTQQHRRKMNVNTFPIKKKEIVSHFAKWKENQPLVFTHQRSVERNGVSWYVPLDEKSQEVNFPSDLLESFKHLHERKVNTLCEPLEKLSLQDACKYFKTSFIAKSNQRLQNVKRAAQNRQHKVYRAQELLVKKLKTNKIQTSSLCSQLHKPKKRYFTHQEMRKQTEMKYKILPEIMSAKEMKRKNEQYTTNRIMAELYKQKILEKTLKGKVSYLITDRCI